MCEASAYFVKDGEEQMVMESVDVMTSEGKGVWRLVDIFGEQKIVKGRIKEMRLVDHKICFETETAG